MEISGKIKVINAEQQVSASFKKRELVVTTEETYPQHIMIEFAQDKCDLLDNYKPGDSVKVSINLRGREWISPSGETKYFNSIQGWRVEKHQAQGPDESPQQENDPAANFTEEDHDDLPF